tara:strand:- start:11535 stop:12089 length:555 start_codon:yes stop_codon:yes gene_type:complete
VQRQPDNLPPPEPSTIPPRLEGSRRARPPGTNLPTLSRNKKSKAPAILWTLVILVLAGMVTGAILKREMIMERVPATILAYETLGLVLPPGAGFSIENQRIRAVQKNGKRAVRIEGDIVNNSGKAAKVPKMLGVIEDNSKRVLKRWRFNPPLPKLLNKERAKFATEVVPPKGSVNYTITFDQRR